MNNTKSYKKYVKYVVDWNLARDRKKLNSDIDKNRKKLNADIDKKRKTMLPRKTVYITEAVYCTRNDKDQLILVTERPYSSHTLSKDCVSKLITVLSEYLIDTPDNNWGPVISPSINVI